MGKFECLSESGRGRGGQRTIIKECEFEFGVLCSVGKRSNRNVVSNRRNEREEESEVFVERDWHVLQRFRDFEKLGRFIELINCVGDGFRRRADSALFQKSV